MADIMPATIEACERVLRTLIRETSQIESRLAAVASGQHVADPSWQDRARAALGIKQRQMKDLQRHMARMLAREAGTEYARRFVAVAGAMLEPEVFQKLADLAQDGAL